MDGGISQFLRSIGINSAFQACRILVDRITRSRVDQSDLDHSGDMTSPTNRDVLTAFSILRRMFPRVVCPMVHRNIEIPFVMSLRLDPLYQPLSKLCVRLVVGMKIRTHAVSPLRTVLPQQCAQPL